MDLIYAYEGDDGLYGGSGNDTISDLARNDRDRVGAGGGNDRVDVDDGDGNDVVNCGSGNRDRVDADRGDTIRKNCERR